MKWVSVQILNTFAGLRKVLKINSSTQKTSLPSTLLHKHTTDLVVSEGGELKFSF